MRPYGADQSGWASLEPYVQLLRVLLPRMTGCSVFNAHGEMCWSSEMALDAEMRKLIEESLKLSETDLESAGQLVEANIDEPMYLFWLRDTAPDTAPDAAPVAAARPYAIVALRCRPVQNTERGSFASGDGVPAPRAAVARGDPRPAQLAGGAGSRS
jgi:hypothetical protein